MRAPVPPGPGRRAIAYAMTEDRGTDSLYANVCEIADGLGLYWHHQRNSIGSKAGWPDLVILGPCGALFRELKTETGRLTIEQSLVGAALTRAGLDWAVWRPSHLLNGTITQRLARIAGFKETP